MRKGKKTNFSVLAKILLWSTLCLLSNVLKAQTDTLESKTKTLVEVLNSLQDRFNIKISYDATLADPIQVIPISKDLSLEEALATLNNKASFELKLVDDDFYLLKAVEKQYSVDAFESDTGTQIPATDLHIFVNNKPIPNKITSEGNKILFKTKLHPRDTLQLYSYGYYINTIPAIDLINSTHKRLKLVADPILLSEVIVSNYLAPGINANTLSHSLEIDMENLALLPGETDGDIFESIKVLPGVSTPDSRAGNVYIRGSSTDQSLILYDDIPIYHKGHYFGTISPYNPKVVKNISVYRNGFSPRLGGRVGGAIDIKSTSNTDDDTSYGAFVNSINAMGYVSTPLVKNKLGVVLSGRTSYPTAWNSPKLQAISDMIYQSSKVEQAMETGSISDFGIQYHDATAKLTYKLTERQKVTLSTLFISNRMEYNVAQPNQNFDEQNELKNTGLNLRWDSKWSDRITSNLSLTHSAYSYSFFSIGSNNDRSSRLSEEKAVNELKDMAGLFEVKASISSSDVLNAGIELKNQSTYYDFLRQTPGSSNSVDNTTATRDLSATSFSPFLNYELSQIKNLYLQIGLRGTYFNGLNDFALAPRVFANYNINDNWQFKGSYGVYNQYLGQIRNLEFSNSGFDNQLWLLSNNEGVKIIKGRQKMLGTLFFKAGWVLDIEAYAKTTEDVTYLSGRFLSSDTEYLSADIETQGIDIFVKKEFSPDLTAWMSYSISESKLSFDTLMNVYYETEYDQPHILKLGGIYHKDNWKISLGWKSMSGLTAQFPESVGDVPQNGDVVVPRGNGQGGMGPGRPGATQPLQDGQHRMPFSGSRFPSMHQLDASISWTLPKTSTRKWSTTIGLSLMNILNQRNLIDQVSRLQESGSIIYNDRFGIGFAPNLMISMEW